MTLGKMLNTSKPPFPHLQNVDKELNKGTTSQASYEDGERRVSMPTEPLWGPRGRKTGHSTPDTSV